MALLRVFDGQFVQAEFVLQRSQLVWFGVFEGDPDEAVGPGEILPDLTQRNVGEPLAALIGNAIDDHRWRRQA